MAARGRPLLIVSRSELEHLLSLRFTWSEIAAILNVSVKTLQRRAKEWDLTRYTNTTLATLEESVREILHNFPSCGEVMINGHLKSKGIHVKRSLLREAIQQVRGRSAIVSPIRRRSYSVPSPNSLWHADGNHKLIKYRLVIHGAVDGFSRLLTFLSCSDNNRAETVLFKFIGATLEYGLPSRIRTDKGGENVGVWRFMLLARGEGRGSYIAASSVHNARIERMWRDVRVSVIDTFKMVFETLEELGVLSVDNDTDLFCLHYIYIPRINTALKQFQEAWNSHSLSTESNWSPLQLFTAYSSNSLLFSDENQANLQDIIDISEEVEEISVPVTNVPLSAPALALLRATIDPLQQSNCYGVDLYMKTIHFVNDFMLSL